VEYRDLHRWDVSEEEARDIQRCLAAQVREEPLDVDAVRLVSGSDMSFGNEEDQRVIPVYAGIVTLELPALNVVEQAGVQTVSPFPYIPGLLSFREVPPLLEAWARLKRKPDALIADGQGRAHPRRFGLACHLGLLLDVPTIGVAKTLFVGTHEPVGENVGDWSPLMHKGEVIGAVLRTRAKVSPVYVSVGHRVDLSSAIALVLRCVGKTHLPETTRKAHEYVNALRRDPGLLAPP
jgi:deoxyribonuclease V